jgi:LCP family protein required for cell wall assembly
MGADLERLRSRRRRSSTLLRRPNWLRRTRKRRPTRQGLLLRGGERHWPRRLLYVSVFVVALLVVAAVGSVVYARWRFGQVHRIHVAGLVTPPPGVAFDVLLVGEEGSKTPSRNSSHSDTVEHADLITLARIDPQTQTARMISIPVGTYVMVAGAVAGVSGPNPIADALAGGPGMLVRTITESFHVPIDDYASFDLSNLPSAVGALGGVHLDFSEPLRDSYSGLNVSNVGCQSLSGTQSLALAESSHLYYFADSSWRIDNGSQLSVIQRQEALFAALVSASKSTVTNPIALNDFVSAVASHLTVSDSLSESKLYSLAETFRGFTAGDLNTKVFPTIASRTRSGAAVMAPAAGPDRRLLRAFLGFGATPGHARSTRPADSPIATVPGLVAVKGAAVEYDTPRAAWDPVPC